MRRRGLTTWLVIVGAVTGSLGWAAQSAAAPESRAVLVVDLGDGDVRVHALSFSGEISGLALLDLAGYAPVTRSFGGLGGAVCALTIDAEIRGCPADSTCLLCDNPRFWSYSRDATRSGAYTVSRYGPSATVVGDGQVEAWRWGTGATPAYVSFESRFPSATTTTGTQATTTTTRGITVTTDATGVTSASDQETTTSVNATTTSAPMVETTEQSEYSAPQNSEDSDYNAVDGPPVVKEHDGDGSGLIAFAILVVVFVLLIIGVRRLRRRLSETDA